MYKACIFDLDGTLTDTLESLTYSVNETLKEMELLPITAEQCRMFVGDGARVLMERALRAAGEETGSRLEEAMERYGRIFGAHCTYHVKPYDGICELLCGLRKAGVKTAVLSNKPHPQTVDVVHTFFGTDTFDWIQGQCEAIPRKPDPAGVHYVAKKLGVSTEACLYIGDSDVDMKTAQAAKVDAVGVTWGFRSRQVLEEAGATHIAKKPEEIMEMVKHRGRT